ncbi:MAG: HAD hydrolase-like protein [bacterium]|nr:HAD hydrolase-like protein [bacterium]
MSIHESKPVEAVLFDLDGVLVDSRDAISQCLNHALTEMGLAPEPVEVLHGWIGASLHDVFRTLLRARGVDAALAPTAIERYRERYTVVAPKETPAFDGVAESLDALVADYRLAVATSKPVEFARPILEGLGIANHFEAIVGAPLERTHHEDKTATVGRALAALGLEAPSPQAVMVGDRHFDIIAGRTHGLTTIGASWGIGGATELRQAGADHLADTPAEIVTLVKKGGRS